MNLPLSSPVQAYDHAYLDDIFGVALLQVDQVRPESVTMRQKTNRLEEIFGVALLPDGQTSPTPVSIRKKPAARSPITSRVSKCLWFDLLPQEIRDRFLELVFADDAALREDFFESIPIQYHTITKRITPQRDTSAELYLPYFPVQFFVSKPCLTEAIRIWAQLSYSHLVEISQVLATKRARKPIFMNKIVYTLSENLKRLVISRFDALRFAHGGRTKAIYDCFPRLQAVHVMGPEDLCWIGGGNDNGANGTGVLTQSGWNDPFTIQPRHRLFLPIEYIHEISDHSRLPGGLRDAIMDRDYCFRFKYTKDFFRSLKRQGWRGKVYYHLELYHATVISSQDAQDGPLFQKTKVIMRINMSAEQVVEVSSHYGQVYAP